jgi:hypothetical protein
MMKVYASQLQVEQLEQEIAKEESNYKNAIDLRRDYYTLREIRKKIRILKDALSPSPKEEKPPFH